VVVRVQECHRHHIGGSKMEMVMSIVREHMAYTMLVFLAGAVGMAIAGYGICLILCWVNSDDAERL